MTLSRENRLQLLTRVSLIDSCRSSLNSCLIRGFSSFPQFLFYDRPRPATRSIARTRMIATVFSAVSVGGRTKVDRHWSHHVLRIDIHDHLDIAMNLSSLLKVTEQWYQLRIARGHD